MTKTHSFLWETHLHTAETSRCAENTAKEMMRACKRAGYHGVVVTDHFLNGYTVAPRNAPWQRRVDGMLKGYKAAKAVGDAIGLVVLLGCEFAYQGGDFLTYGVDEAFYRDQPDLADLSIDAYVQRVHAAGGLISQAHPYREAVYMPADVAKRWDIVDAVEVYNGSHATANRIWDDRALAMAREHSLLMTAGSDAHRISDVGTAAIAFDEAFDTDEAFLAALRSGVGEIIRNRA